MEFFIFRVQKFRFSSIALQEFGITFVSLKYHQGSLAIPRKYNYKLRKAIICYAPSRKFDYMIMKFDLISVNFRLHGLSTVFRNFLKNVKTLEPQVISGRNIIFSNLVPYFFNLTWSLQRVALKTTTGICILQTFYFPGKERVIYLCNLWLVYL